MVTGLPSADSLVASIAALRRKLAVEEAGFRATQFSATSSDALVTATTNGMVEALTVAIQPSAFPVTPPATVDALAASIKDACAKALAAANNNTKAKASADAAGYTLTGIPNLGQSPPPTPGFASSDADLTALLRAQDPVITARQFLGVAGPVSATVDGTLTLVSITLSPPLGSLRTSLEENVVIAINLAIAKAKHLFEDGIQRRVNGGVDSSAVTWQDACLYAQGKLIVNDRTKVLRQNGTFAPVVNAGSTQTNIGQSTQVGDLWSRVSVDLRNFAKVNGNLRTMGTVNPQAGATVSGLTVQNAALLQIPKLSLSVTFPGTSVVNQEAGPPPAAPLDLAPGAYGDVSVKGTLKLRTGTYFFNNLTVESNAKISCTSTSGQIVVNIRTNLTYRGSIVEGTSGRRPNIFVGVFGTNAVFVETAFPGTLVALTASLTLGQNSPSVHSGAFYAMDITVGPDNTITHFPFLGPPALTST